jgi:hypothetical protein
MNPRYSLKAAGIEREREREKPRRRRQNQVQIARKKIGRQGEGDSRWAGRAASIKVSKIISRS